MCHVLRENIIQNYKEYGLLVQTIATSYLKGLEEYWHKQYTQYQENMEKDSINSDYSIQEYDQKLPTTNLSTSHITRDKKVVLFTLRSQWGLIFNGDHDLHVLCAYNQDSFTFNRPVLTSSHLNHKLEKKLKESDKEEPKLGGINFIKELINKYVLKRFIVQDLENNLHQVSLKNHQVELYENFTKAKEWSTKFCLNKQIANLKDAKFIKNKSKPKNHDIIHNEILIAPPEYSVKSISAMFFFIKGAIGTQSYHHEMLNMGLDEQEEAIKFATTYHLPILYLDQNGVIVDPHIFAISESLIEHKHLHHLYLLPDEAESYKGFCGKKHRTEAAIYHLTKLPPENFKQIYGITKFKMQEIISLIFISNYNTLEIVAKSVAHPELVLEILSNNFLEEFIVQLVRLNAKIKFPNFLNKAGLELEKEKLINDAAIKLQYLKINLSEVLSDGITLEQTANLLLCIVKCQNASLTLNHHMFKNISNLELNEHYSTAFHELLIYKNISEKIESDLVSEKDYSTDTTQHELENITLIPKEVSYDITSAQSIEIKLSNPIVIGTEFIHKLQKKLAWMMVDHYPSIHYRYIDNSLIDMNTMIPANYLSVLAEFYEQNAGTIEYSGKWSLRDHHQAVICNFLIRCKSGINKVSMALLEKQNISIEFIVKLLALHDIGKGINRNAQHACTLSVIEKYKKALMLEDDEYILIHGLLSEDYLGKYFANINTLDATVYSIIELYKKIKNDSKLSLDIEGLLLLYLEYYISDISAYSLLRHKLLINNNLNPAMDKKRQELFSKVLEHKIY